MTEESNVVHYSTKGKSDSIFRMRIVKPDATVLS